jgi:hypothetical protein
MIINLATVINHAPVLTLSTFSWYAVVRYLIMPFFDNGEED